MRFAPTASAVILSAILVGVLFLRPGPHAQFANADTEGHRRDFVEAEASLKRGDRDRYLKLRRELSDYPLLPYLELADLRSRLGSVDELEVDNFLDRFDDTPAGDSLRAAWLDRLAENQRWNAFLRYYRPEGSAARKCQWLQALLASGRDATVWPEVPALWLTGHSQPNECDPVFAAWRKRGRLTATLVWERISLAMAADNLALAEYLTRYLEPDDQTWANRWLQADREPQVVLAQEYSTPHPWRDRILSHAVQTLARRAPSEASILWAELRRRFELDPNVEIQVERSLALAANWRSFDGSLADFDRVNPCRNDRPWLESRLRTALGSRAWNQALAWIDELPDEVRDLEAWRYWKARSLEELGQPEEAATIYRNLAGERTYYGFLSADRAGQPYRRNERPLRPTESELAKVAALPGARRSYELLQLNRIGPARREWAHLVNKLEPAQITVAAKLAHLWEWPDRAIFTLARAEYWDDLEVRFPLLYRGLISQAAGSQNLDAAWLYAIIRQESAFIEDARSGAGALGLMQLLPATARQLAPARARLSTRDILAPDTNIRLGASYLSKLDTDFDRHPVLATASYNAGPRRVREWLPEGRLPADLWIETIPYPETREYVRRVLAYRIIYRDRLELPAIRLKDLLPAVAPLDSAYSTSKLGHKASDQG